tara:strand:- start:311 stop:952 length:642 start_codon:yes stop_codon:yes gene_type:complete
MSSGMSFPTNISVNTPNTMIQEGGISAGAMSIQSLNTTAIMQMYENTADMWRNITRFGQEMLDLSHKWVMWEYKMHRQEEEDKLRGLGNWASQPGSREKLVEEVIEEADKRLRASGRQEPPVDDGTEISSHQSREDDSSEGSWSIDKGGIWRSDKNLWKDGVRNPNADYRGGATSPKPDWVKTEEVMEEHQEYDVDPDLERHDYDMEMQIGGR